MKNVSLERNIKSLIRKLLAIVYADEQRKDNTNYRRV